jgi:hypothetical protein
MNVKRERERERSLDVEDVISFISPAEQVG